MKQKQKNIYLNFNFNFNLDFHKKLKFSIFTFLLSAISIIGSGCSFSKEEALNDEYSKEAQEIQAKTQELTPYVGIYQGQLRGGNFEYQTQVNLYIQGKPEGQNSKKEAVLLPTLKAAIKWLNPVLPTIIYDVRVSKASHQLILTRTSDSAQNIKDSQINLEQLTFTIQDDSLVADFNEKGEIIGSMQVLLTTRKQDISFSGQDLDYYDRLLKEQTTFTGIYSGDMTSENGEKSHVVLKLFTHEDTQNVIARSELLGRLDYLNSLPPTNLNIIYQMGVKPVKMTLSNYLLGGAGTNNGIPSNTGAGRVTLKVTWEKGVIRGSYANNQGDKGTLILVRQ